MRIRTCAKLLAALGLLGFLAGALAAAPAAAAAAPGISLRSSRAQVSSGRAVTLSGALTGAPAGTKVSLYALPYPYRRRVLLASLTPDPVTGAYSAGSRPDRDTRFRAVAVVPGAVLSAQRQVDVSGRADIDAKALSLGRASVSVLVFHPSDLNWNG